MNIKKMKKIIYLHFLLFTLIINGQTSNVEKLENWIFPKESNYNWYRTKNFDGKKITTSTLKISYYKISDNQVGTSEKFIFKGDETLEEFKLFEIDTNEIKLLKIQEAVVVGNDKKSIVNFDKNNTFWKLPMEKTIMKWNYTGNGGTFYKCKSYWKIGEKNEKYLIVEKEVFEAEDVEFSREKEIEWFKKNKGLYKYELLESRSNELLESYTSQESGFDTNIEKDSFPFENKQHLTNKTPIKTDNLNTEKKIEYQDGTIPKEYKIKILVDRGLPYLVKDTIIVKNKNGIINIPEPKLNKSEKAIFYNGKEVYIDGYIEDAKIIAINYFQSLYSTKQEVYYSDGEGNFKIVKNSGLFLEEDGTINTNVSTSEWVMKDIKKDSDLFFELSKEDKLKKQGIYLIKDRVSEENIKTHQILQIKFNNQE